MKTFFNILTRIRLDNIAVNFTSLTTQTCGEFYSAFKAIRKHAGNCQSRTLSTPLPSVKIHHPV